MLSGKENGMKTFIIVTLTLLLIISCRKSSIDDQRLLTGKWELRQSAGGIAGTINYAAGNGYLVEFYNNNQYQFTYPPSVNFIPPSGPYQLTRSSRSGDWLLQLQYVLNSQTVTEKDSVRFEGSKLIFLPAASCCDIPTITYEKWKK